jgi:2-keto-4-pentenoate hydratase
MDPVTLATAAVSLVAPYLIDFAKDETESAGKSVWAWIKGKLTSPAGAEAVADVETAPDKPENAQALQAALTKALTKDPAAATALAKLLSEHGASLSTLTLNVAGSRNKTGQADRGSTVNIS